MNIKNPLARYIESEIYDYHDTLKLIKQLEDDIIGDTGVQYDKDKTGPTNKVTSPTEDKALNLLTNKQLDKAKTTARAIERVFRVLPSDKQRYMMLLYWQRKGWQCCTMEIGISEKTSRRWRKEIIEAVANEMGHIIEQIRSIKTRKMSER